MSKQLTRHDREAQREADVNSAYYDDGQEPEPAPVRKCTCWFNNQGELILRGWDCAEHGEANS